MVYEPKPPSAPPTVAPPQPRPELDSAAPVEGGLSCTVCDKTYMTRAGLWKHKKMCNNVNNLLTPQQPVNTVDLLSKMVIEIVKSNTELQRQCADMQKTVLDVCQKMQSNSNNQGAGASNVTTSPGNAANNNMTTTTVISQNNNNNKTFNMQVFLNEHCKDAMNLTEFVDSIDLNLDDLESVGKAGFVDGISNIIIGKLRDTEVHLRPIHCSDAKREVMYIKENNKWAKEGPKNENMRKFVQYIERKNIKLLGEYQQKYPESRDYESPLNDHYVQLSLTATCATPEHLDKVISRIAKEVLIDK